MTAVQMPHALISRDRIIASAKKGTPEMAINVKVNTTNRLFYDPRC